MKSLPFALFAMMSFLLAGCDGSTHAATADTSSAMNQTEFAKEPIPPAISEDPTDKVELTDAQWRARLTREQYSILRMEDTEPRCFAGNWHDNGPGRYACAGCGLLLFSYQQKFESGTGWPSFWQPIKADRITNVEDRSFGMVRTEVRCARCGGHLGHVFEDGPPPSGLRYCINYGALMFVPDNKTADTETKTN